MTNIATVVTVFIDARRRFSLVLALASIAITIFRVSFVVIVIIENEIHGTSLFHHAIVVAVKMALVYQAINSPSHVLEHCVADITLIVAVRLYALMFNRCTAEVTFVIGVLVDAGAESFVTDVAIMIVVFVYALVGNLFPADIAIAVAIFIYAGVRPRKLIGGAVRGAKITPMVVVFICAVVAYHAGADIAAEVTVGVV